MHVDGVFFCAVERPLGINMFVVGNRWFTIVLGWLHLPYPCSHTSCIICMFNDMLKSESSFNVSNALPCSKMASVQLVSNTVTDVVQNPLEVTPWASCAATSFVVVSGSRMWPKLCPLNSEGEIVAIEAWAQIITIITTVVSSTLTTLAFRFVLASSRIWSTVAGRQRAWSHYSLGWSPSPLENCIVRLVTSGIVKVRYQSTSTLKVVPLHLYCWYNKSLSNARN